MTPVRFVPLTRTGQLPPLLLPGQIAPLVPAQVGPLVPTQPIPIGYGETPAQRQQVIDQVRAVFRELTFPLIIGAIGIGVATGIGSTVGTALGALFVERFMTPPHGRGGGR